MSAAAVKEVSVTARLPEVDVERLDQIAKGADRSRSAELRRAVRLYLDAHRPESEEAA